MYASLRGASSTEDSAKLDRSSSWNQLARAATNPSQSHSERGFSVPTELPTPFADLFHAKELVPHPLRPRSASTKTYSSSRSTQAPISIRGKKVSVSDLVGKFESQDSGCGFAPTPIGRSTTAPSPQIRSVYRPTLPRANTSRQHRAPRQRLVSSETIQEVGGPFTLEQVTAATSFTTSRTCAQTSASELPATSAVETLLLEDAGEQASFEYYDEVTRAKSHRPDQSVQAEPSYQHASLQISPARQDKAVQITAEYRDQETQLTAHYVDQGVQSALSSEHLQVQDTRIHQAPSAANGKRIFHNQASQTDHDYSFVSKSPVQKDSKSPLLIIHAVEAGGQPHESRNSGHIVISENPESHSSTDIAFFTAKNCSTVSPTQRTEPLDFGVSLDPNTVTIEFPEGAIVHMLQRIRGGKIVIDPGLLPRARSSEALAQGKIYTPHQVRDQEPNCAARSSRSASSASYSVASSTSSPEKTSSSPPKVTTVEASKTAEDSHYSDARQQLTSQTHESAESFNYQHDPSTKTEAVRSGEAVADLIISAPELPLAAESGAQKRLDHVNGKQKAPSVAYLFESEDENPKEVGQASPTRPQTLGQFQSVPLIRVQRPSTDSEMMFRLGTRAVKPSPSAHPLVCAADPPAVPTDHVIIPPASPAKKVSRRERIKRKGRKKLILRKKVLRFLLGTELAERVSHDWSTTENTSRGGTGAAQVANDASGAVPTPVASRSQLPEPALPLGITPLAPAQVDGSDCRSTVSGDSSSVTSLDTDTAPSISALDGLQEREAKRRAKKELKLQKKEQEHVEAYELAKTNLEALTSTPCIKCGGQRAFILNFVWENKNNMLKHEQPEMKRRHRKKAVTEYVESIECRCPLGTSTAAHGCPEAVSKAKEMYTKTKARTTSQRVSTSYHPNTYASTTADNTAETGGAHF